MKLSLEEYCLQFDREDLLQEWHPYKNDELSPNIISHGSKKRIWWTCSNGHEWETPVYARTGKYHGCPYCAGKRIAQGADLKAQYPDIAKQWHPTLNAPLEPTMVTIGSAKKVWWRCPLGHEWKAVVYSRAGVQKCGCPVCAGKKSE